ncbi:hypothetical protein G9A89_011121 [Geosiphon pyriformis]|nr:hypothetical protein G9A89_011121 [Geosiphon pyriformis]
MSEIMAYCLAIWNNVRKHDTLLNNDIALVKDPEIRVGHLIEISLPEETPIPSSTASSTKLWVYYLLQQPNNYLEPAPTNKSTVAESESIEANHLEFVKSLFQHYCQHLGLNHNQISAESAFNFYINERIAYLLKTLVNTESVRETFYHKLIQNTSLPTNYNFASIITEINKKIEHHIQQRYPITYASKDKGKLQTLAVTLQWIQPPT